MTMQQPKSKGFFAKHRGLLLSGVIVVVILIYLFVLKGNAQVIGLRLSTDNLVLGGQLNAQVELENTKLLSCKYTAVLMVDGKKGPSGVVTLEPKKPQTINMDISNIKAGKHTIRIGGIEKEFTVLQPATFQVSNLIVSADSVMVGDTVTVSITAKNSGEVEGIFKDGFTINNTKIDFVSTAIAPGEKITLSSQWVVTTGGQQNVSIKGLQAAFTALNPAKIKITSLSVSGAFAKPGQAVTATVKLENTGDVLGMQTVDLSINNLVVQKMDVTVGAHKTAQAEFPVTQAKTGKYVIAAGGFTKTLDVVVTTRPATGTLLVNAANGGYCTVAISNGYANKDALFVFASTANPAKALMTVYVQANSTTKKIKIKNDTYAIFYATGTDFDPESKRFLTDVSYNKFANTLVSQGSSYFWNDFTLSIYVSNGNASVKPVDEDDYPK